MSTIRLPVSYQEALKGAKPITVEQTKIIDGTVQKIPIVIPPLNTNIAFSSQDVLKSFRQPRLNLYNNDFNTQRQSNYKTGNDAW